MIEADFQQNTILCKTRIGAPYYNLQYPIPIGLLCISFVLVRSDKYKNLLAAGCSAHRLFTASCDTNRHVDGLIMVFVYLHNSLGTYPVVASLLSFRSAIDW